MAIYYVYSGAGGTASGNSWANAKLTLGAAFLVDAAGDTIYVAHDHAESTAGVPNLASAGTLSNPVKCICVDRGGTVPPVAADLRTTATVTTTGANGMNLSGACHFYGITFNIGTGAVTAHVLMGQTSSNFLRFDNCSMRIVATGASLIQIGQATVGGVCVEFNNTTASFAAATGQGFSFVGGTLKWRNTASALLGTIPDTLFLSAAQRGGALECIGVDLSAAGSGKTLVGSLSTSQSFSARFVDCKLNASVTQSAVPTALGSTEIDSVRSGSSGVNYTVYSHRPTGLLIEETTIVRTGGATDGTTPLAWKIVTTAGSSYTMPFECPPIAIWNDTTGSSVTATVEGIAATLPTDQEVWLEVEYLGDASSPQGSFVNDGKANLLATAANQTSSSEVWGGSTAAFSLAVTFTPQQAGWVYARVKCAKLSSTFYIDPLVTLT